jgi:hypothetical protein
VQCGLNQCNNVQHCDIKQNNIFCHIKLHICETSHGESMSRRTGDEEKRINYDSNVT